MMNRSVVILAGAFVLTAAGMATAAKPAPATSPRPVKMLEPIDLGKLANAKVDIPLQPPAGDVPLTLISGDKNALDVSTSLSGWKESDGNVLQVSRVANTERGRLVFSLPADNYSAMHVLAYSTGREGTAPRMTVRIGNYGGGTALMHDVVVDVPLLSDAEGKAAYVVSRSAVDLPDGKKGYVSLLRVPMAGTANIPLTFKSFDVEFTRDINVHLGCPAPADFAVMPAGAPSGVVVLAVTMQRSPIKMEYAGEQLCNVFEEGQGAVFKFKLTNRTDKPVTARAALHCSGPGTGEEVAMTHRQWTVQQEVPLEAGESKEVPLDASPKHRGWYACQVAVEAGGQVLQARDTTFAMLAPDTRKARGDSPFGVWCFWNSHSRIETPNRTEKLASLIRKGGWRWTYGGSPGVPKGQDAAAFLKDLCEKYLFNWTLQYPPYAKRGGKIYGAWYEPELFEKEVVPWLKNARERGIDNHYIVLHEARTSRGTYVRFNELFGGKPYEMPPKEKAAFELQYEHAEKFIAAMKQADPTARVVFGNDYPGYLSFYMAKGFPKELIDVWGMEGAMAAREPERQPDWVCLLGQIHLMKRLQAKYGYDKPMWFTESLYHNTSPGTLSLHQQANIYCREAMLALALGVQRLAACGEVVDSSDNYRWSHWGSVGYCFLDPEFNPKPSYVMYSWMTQALDQAKPDGFVAGDSTVLHVLKFRKADGSYVCPMWVVRGRQEVQLEVDGAAMPTVYDAFGNDLNVLTADGKLTVTVGDSPIYIVGPAVTKVLSRKPFEITPWTEANGKIGVAPTVRNELGEEFEGASAAEAIERAIKSEWGLATIVEFDKADQMSPVDAPSKVLEADWPQPRVKGNYRSEYVTEDGATCLRLQLQADDDHRKLLPRYIELALKDPLVLPGRPWELTTRLKGNGGWGRVMFELVDAKGRVWTSSGSQNAAAPNSNDPAGDSNISFDGWGTVRTLLPGAYAGKDQYVIWPGQHNWWPTNTPEGQAKAKLRAEAAAEAAAAAAAEPAEEPAASTTAPATGPAAADAKAEAKKAADAKAAAKKAAKAQAARLEDQGDEPVDYPVKLTKIIIELRPEILYVTEQRPVTNNVIYLDRVTVSRPPPGR